MNKLVKSLAVLGMITTAGVATMTTETAEASAKTTNVSVKSYKSYLKNYDSGDAKRAGVNSQYINEAVSGAKKQLNDFNALSKDSQQKFVNSLKKLTNSNYTDKTLDNGSPFSLLRASTKSKSVQYTYSKKPGKYWPSITTVRIRVNYKVKGKKVIKTTGSDAYVVRNYNPFVSLSKDGQKRHVSKNHAYAWARWSYTLGLGKYGIMLGHLNASVEGNYKGNRIYYRGWKN